MESNDPDNPAIKLTIMATVKAEITITPPVVYLRDMQQGEQRNEKVRIKNTSPGVLEILSIETGGGDMLTVDLLNRSPEWPIELKTEEELELIVGFRYQTENPRFSRQILIKYSGGQVTDAFIRIYAMLKQEQKALQPPGLPGKVDPEKLKNLNIIQPGINPDAGTKIRGQNPQVIKPESDEADPNKMTP